MAEKRERSFFGRNDGIAKLSMHDGIKRALFAITHVMVGGWREESRIWWGFWSGGPVH